MGNYRLSPAAKDDLYRIWLYGLEQWGMDAADHYHAELLEQFENIASSPLQYPAVDDIRERYRRSVCSQGRNSIYYRIEDKAVEIMAIIGQQDLDKWL